MLIFHHGMFRMSLDYPKMLTYMYPILARCLQNIIDDPELSHSFMLNEITYMLSENQMPIVFQILDQQSDFQLFKNPLRKAVANLTCTSRILTINKLYLRHAEIIYLRSSKHTKPAHV